MQDFVFFKSFIDKKRGSSCRVLFVQLCGLDVCDDVCDDEGDDEGDVCLKYAMDA